MARKQPPFPPEATTRPDHKSQDRARRSGPPPARGNLATKRRPASEVPTLPPPPPSSDQGRHARDSGRAGRDETPKTPKVSSAVRPKARTSTPAANVDEVTADMRKDPRREDD
jgi:hypothetical protein